MSYSYIVLTSQWPRGCHVSTSSQNKEGTKYQLIDWIWSSALMCLKAVISNWTLFPCLPKTNFMEIINVTTETKTWTGYTCFQCCTVFSWFIFCTKNMKGVCYMWFDLFNLKIDTQKWVSRLFNIFLKNCNLFWCLKMVFITNASQCVRTGLAGKCCTSAIKKVLYLCVFLG